LPHETTIEIANVLGVSALSVLLRLLAPYICSSHASRCSTISQLAWRVAIALFWFSVPLRCADTAGLCTAPFIHAIPIAARVRRNRGRLHSNGFIERAQSTSPNFTSS
jgi:hypothetical protein